MAFDESSGSKVRAGDGQDMTWHVSSRCDETKSRPHLAPRHPGPSHTSPKKRACATTEAISRGGEGHRRWRGPMVIQLLACLSHEEDKGDKKEQDGYCCSESRNQNTRRLTISQRLDWSHKGPHLRKDRRRALVRVRGEEKSPDDKLAIRTDGRMSLETNLA